MIDPQEIFKATNGGLDIILDCYPQAKACVNTKKHFAIRNERTPSASLREYDSKKYGRIWQVTDFGGDGRGENAISVYMNARGMQQTQYGEALLQLASKYGVKDELDRAVNKPTIRKRPANADEKEGDRHFKLKEKMTNYELSILGPKVKQSDVDALHWFAVDVITYCKDREVIEKYSNEHYPIFARACLIAKGKNGQPDDVFYKIYEPLNCDKGFRFTYMPSGKKPLRYVNGLAELKEAYQKYNKEEEADWMASHGEDQPYKEKKLPEAIICSGERDSLCCHSMGYHPLWFNSETYHVSPEEYREIMKYVERLYNIPDIDETGVRKGRELALAYIDIHTIWLPKWLEQYHDNRGHSRKDLRDWMELRSEKKNFKDLMENALPAKFWTEKLTKDGNRKVEIDSACLFNFLTLNGFYTLHDENSDSTEFIRIEGNVVKHVKANDIKQFIINWVKEHHKGRDILNLVINSPRVVPTALDNLDEVELDFADYTPASQYYFFDNATVEVKKRTLTNDGINVYSKGDESLHNFVWENNVIAHRFKKQDPMFKIKTITEDDGRQHLDIEVKNVNSHFFGYLINTSRLFWRKETEYNFEGHPDEERIAYLEEHPFDIAGTGLSEEEIREQKQNLINKIFCFGYMMHKYKIVTRAWAPMAMDNKIGEDGQCNGRSGKSFFFTVLSYLESYVKLSGRNPKLMDNPHVFEQVNQFTDFVLVDDCDRYLNLGQFYDNITSDMTINPKNNHVFTIPFNDSPKFAFTTNYVPQNFDPSSEARTLYMVFSDWYHQKTEDNDYIETRSIRDDFNKTLYATDYTEEEWNNDFNFWMQCCSTYIELADAGMKPQPPMGNIKRRRWKAEMGGNFEEWANSYFSPENEHLDKELVREDVFRDYQVFSNMARITMQSFTKKIKAFCDFCPWVDAYNPTELCTDAGRLQRKVLYPDGTLKTKDMIYIRSVAGAKENQNGKDQENDIF